MQRALLIAALLYATAATAHAGTTRFKSEGVGIVALKLYPLANGSEVQTFETQQVARVVDGPLKGETASGVCSGSGVSTKETPWLGEVWCTYAFNKDDAYSIHIAEDTVDGGSFTVIGGKGRFKDATGSGTFAYTWGDVVVGDRVTWTAETEIITP